jgi:hypothetical protein
MSQAILQRVLAVLALGVARMDGPQEATVRVRGTIERDDGDTYFVQARWRPSTASVADAFALWNQGNGASATRQQGQPCANPQ